MSFVEYVTCIEWRKCSANGKRRGYSRHDKVLGLFAEPVVGEGKSVIKHTEVKSEVKLFRGFPLEVEVTHSARH